jgi:hypothetical protein
MTTEQIILIVAAVFGSQGLWQFITKVYENRHKKDTVEREALRMLLHDRLYKDCRYYIKAGKIDVDGLENMNGVYKSYHNLGGNGTGTALYERVSKLPITEDDDV